MGADHITLEIDESQRQVTLMALAHLAVERPGWDYVLAQIALKMDNEQADGTPQMYTEFKQLHAPTHLITLTLDKIGEALIQPPSSNPHEQEDKQS